MFFFSFPAFQKKQGNANIAVSDRILNFFQFSLKGIKIQENLLKRMVTAIRSRLGLFAIEIYIFSLGPLKHQVLSYILCNKTPQKQTEKMSHEFR